MKVMAKIMTGFPFEKKRKIQKIYVDINRVILTLFHYKVKHAAFQLPTQKPSTLYPVGKYVSLNNRDTRSMFIDIT